MEIMNKKTQLFFQKWKVSILFGFLKFDKGLCKMFQETNTAKIHKKKYTKFY